jgi:L-threonylcarbamoyladenylate synthase
MVGEHEIADAVAVLRRGGLVAFPTETVYGLGCDAESRDALLRLYEVKRRPTGHPVIVHLPSVECLDDWAQDVPRVARTLADGCWPGPLTLVVLRNGRVPNEVTGGSATVALRVPDQPVALALLRAFDGGIAAPSANRFGRVSPTTADDVRADLDDDVDLVLDDGPCTVGVESTIVDCTGDEPAILRLGGVPQERVEELVGARVTLSTQGEVSAPGTTPVHYAPDTRVVLVDADHLTARAQSLVDAGFLVGVLGLEAPPDLPPAAVVLDTPHDVPEYARVLYARLREADRLGLDALLVVPPPAKGLGAAVVDRVRRAAAREVSATP